VTFDTCKLAGGFWDTIAQARRRSDDLDHQGESISVTAGPRKAEIALTGTEPHPGLEVLGLGAPTICNA
jgi:hypothetical protein